MIFMGFDSNLKESTGMFKSNYSWFLKKLPSLFKK